MQLATAACCALLNGALSTFLCCKLLLSAGAGYDVQLPG